MTVMRWDELQVLMALREREVERARARGQSWTPPVDVVETEDAYVIAAELPGLSEADFDVHVTSDSLTLRGRRPVPDCAGHEYLRLERPHGAFQRRFGFPLPVDGTAVIAHFQEGVLTVTVPKAIVSTGRRVDIS
ncbi:MAG: Hsp20/alpha crystallin family protein [Vicinamibacterales bacterium]